jgi:hypothetical protein
MRDADELHERVAAGEGRRKSTSIERVADDGVASRIEPGGAACTRQRRHIVSAREKSRRQRGAEVPRGAGDEHSHVRSLVESGACDGVTFFTS